MVIFTIIIINTTTPPRQKKKKKNTFLHTHKDDQELMLNYNSCLYTGFFSPQAKLKDFNTHTPIYKSSKATLIFHHKQTKSMQPKI